MVKDQPNADAAEASRTEAAGLAALLGQASRPRVSRGLVLAMAALLILLVAVAVYRLGFRTEAAAWATQPATRGSLTVAVTATGNLQPTNEVQVGSEQSGLVVAVFVDNNDKVSKGQPLARLDTSRLADTLAQTSAAVAVAEAQVVQARASEDQAKADLARLETLWRATNGDAPAQIDLDAARANARRAAAALKSAQAQVLQARAQLSSAQTSLRKATVYSPVTGVVLSRQVDPGQTVAASLQAPTLFRIGEDLSRMKLEVRVDEADVAQVREGQRASFTVDAYPGRSFPAQVARVDLGANASGSTTTGASTSSAAAGSVIAYTAVLDVDNAAMRLRPGMTATASIVTAERRDALLIPNPALRFSPQGAGQTGRPAGVAGLLMARPGRPRARQEVGIGRGASQTVYLLQDGAPRPVSVVVGETNGSLTEVLSGGLRPGAPLIVGRLAATDGR